MRALDYLTHLAAVWRYDDPEKVRRLGERLAIIYGNDASAGCFPVANGRTALETILRSLSPAAGDEVIVQSFTCVAAVNPILWAGMTPVFVDADERTLSLSLESLRQAISPKTRAIIIQHSFGIPGPTAEVVNLAHERGIVVIEDCAHALGVRTADGSALGSRADAAIISFGIEKMLSTKFGGALLVNNPDLQTAAGAAIAALPRLSRVETARWLVYPLFITLLRRVPGTVRRWLSSMLVSTGLLRQAVARAEYAGKRPPAVPGRLPGVHAAVVLDALAALPSNLDHRTALATEYLLRLKDVPGVQPVATTASPLIKFPVLCRNRSERDALAAALTSKGIPVATWYDPAVFPAGVDHAVINYDPTRCPVAEDCAGRILCLPTSPSITPAYATMIANELKTAATHLPEPPR